jgi:hypothetical protein
MIYSDACLSLFLFIVGTQSTSSWTSPSTPPPASKFSRRTIVTPSSTLGDDSRISFFTGRSKLRYGVAYAVCRLHPLSVTSAADYNESRIPDINVGGDESARIVRTVRGPDLATKPDYGNIHGPLGKVVDRLFLTVFRTQLAKHVGVDSNLPKASFWFGTTTPDLPSIPIMFPHRCGFVVFFIG